MALSKKGWRKITVNENLYYWKTKGTDWGINTVIVTSEAFISGQTSQKILFNLDYINFDYPINNQQNSVTIVTPRVIHLAIEIALSKKLPFTGKPNMSDVILKREDIDRLYLKAQMEISALV